MELKFYKKSTRPSNLAEGSVWFNPTTKRIELLTGANSSDVYGSDIQDASYSNNILTITKIDGSSLEIDLSNYASTSDISSLESSLASKLNKIKVNNGTVYSTDLNFVGGGGTTVSNSNGTITISSEEAPTTFDASAITSGTINIQRLPKGALERLFIVDSESDAMSADCQEGDTVQVTGNNNKMYFCINESATSFANKFHEYTAGTATSVPWSGVTDAPSIEDGAQKNVQSNWNEEDTSSDAYILNKPNVGKVYELFNDFGINTSSPSITSANYSKLRNVILGIIDEETNDSIIAVWTYDGGLDTYTINWSVYDNSIIGNMTPNVANIDDSGTTTTAVVQSYISIFSSGRVILGTSSATIPTKTSDLNNDSNFITSGDIPTKTSDLTNDSGFLTSIPEASSTTIGGIKLNTSASSTYGLTTSATGILQISPASSTSFGGIYVGSGINVDTSGRISLPIASGSSLGGVKVNINSGLTVNSTTGYLTVDNTIATKTDLAAKQDVLAYSDSSDSTVILVNNTLIDLGTRSSTITITFPTLETSVHPEYWFRFTASSSTAPTLSLPSTCLWQDGKTPTIKTGETYEFCIADKLVSYSMFKSAN